MGARATWLCVCAGSLGMPGPAWGAPAAGSPSAASGSEAVRLDLKTEAAAQYQTLVVQIANRAWFERDVVAAQACDPKALILKEDRDPLDVALRRTRALLEEVRRMGPRCDLSAAEAGLKAAEVKARNIPPVSIALVKSADFPNAGRAVWFVFTPPPPAGPRYELFLEVSAFRRRIALANPLLDFDRILFVKRDNPFTGHMVTYPGRAGGHGGLFELAGAFGAAPALRNVLAGRPGAACDVVCAFDLSYDGRTIVASGGFKGAKGWSLFRVNADGSDWKRLTDGSYNDVDPCFLPDGRVAFLSDQRGGYGRCHGWGAPVISTLHVMNADGSGRVCLSFHETNEWNPSVGNDGKILYTRWDYVDREPDIAHHLWTTFPDGRDPRSFHGNYPPPKARRGAGENRFGHRPFGEWSGRAVPGRSGLFVATAGSHHGPPTFGSLVLIDQTREDDGETSQVRRLTPDAPFPEAEQDVPRNCEYGYAWPLSDRYFLCAYNGDNYGVRVAKNRLVPANTASSTDVHGLYLVDVFGNKELLYRDPATNSFYPIPLRARPAPPVIPPQTAGPAKGAGEAGAAARPATVAVMNVYESDFDWPPDARIVALRLVQLLPKTTHANNRPRIGVADQGNARAVLGTVPVERDGSAYFEAPPGKPFYFQALDERGLAIQSMRSVTYLQPGEQMTCLGCHEPKRAIRAPDRSPAALRRPPSKLQPDVEGSNPFSYVRLVQPVLDRHCAACHMEKKAIDLGGARFSAGTDKRQKSFECFTRSYMNLAPKYGFWFDSVLGCSIGPRGGARTVAGRFGARAAPLLALLDTGHHGVKLPPEDFHRLTLWLDCNSDFYGVYHDTEAQLRGEIVRPDLE
jgi:hypothetical protein